MRPLLSSTFSKKCQTTESEMTFILRKSLVLMLFSWGIAKYKIWLFFPLQFPSWGSKINRMNSGTTDRWNDRQHNANMSCKLVNKQLWASSGNIKRLSNTTQFLTRTFITFLNLLVQLDRRLVKWDRWNKTNYQINAAFD